MVTMVALVTLALAGNAAVRDWAAAPAGALAQALGPCRVEVGNALPFAMVQTSTPGATPMTSGATPIAVPGQSAPPVPTAPPPTDGSAAERARGSQPAPPAVPGVVAEAPSVGALEGTAGSSEVGRTAGHRAGGDEVVRVGTSYTLPAGERRDQVVVVMGTATVDGHVAGDVVVVLGDLRLGPSAIVDGNIVVAGGSVGVREGASAHSDVVVIGGTLDAPSLFTPGGEQVVIGFKALGDGARGMLPWLFRGLLWGRPIVPELPWVWAVVAVLLAAYLAVLLVFEQPVRATAGVLHETPLKAFVTGLAVTVLFFPVVVLLAATVVGLLVVPVAVCALVAAGVVGRVASARWLGARIVSEGDASSRARLLRSFVIGSAVLIVAYMVPVVGGLVWALLGAAGLGAAVLTFASAYRIENPPAAPRPPVPPPPIATVEAGGGVPVMSEGAASSRAAESATASTLALMPRAPFTDRLAAFVLDAILVAMVIGIAPTLDDEVFVPLFLAYRFGMWVWKGVTVGGIICQLRITKLDGSPMSGGEALVRSLGSLFSVAVFGIGCLWVLRDPDRQSWHDKMAGTYVVKVPRNWLG